jgi:hypothetical protein
VTFRWKSRRTITRHGVVHASRVDASNRMQADNQERRRDVRTHVSPPAQILRKGDAERVEIVNASYRGLFIRTAGAPPPTSQLVKIRIQLPARAIEIHAVPVRIVTDTQGRTGVGLRFFALNGELRQIWDSYISSLLSPQRRIAA